MPTDWVWPCIDITSKDGRKDTGACLHCSSLDCSSGRGRRRDTLCPQVPTTRATMNSNRLELPDRRWIFVVGYNGVRYGKFVQYACLCLVAFLVSLLFFSFCPDPCRGSCLKLVNWVGTDYSWRL